MRLSAIMPVAEHTYFKMRIVDRPQSTVHSSLNWYSNLIFFGLWWKGGYYKM